MATSSEIFAALDSFRIHLESQLTATNSTIKACMQLVDSKFAELLSTPPSSSLAAASFSVFRSGGSSSAPQQSRLPTAPFQSPGSASPGVPFLSFDVTSTAASTSFSAAPPRFLSYTNGAGKYDLGVKTPDDSVTRDTGVDSSRIASTVDGLLLPVELFGKAPSPAPEPAPEVTPPPNSHFRPISPTPPPTAQSASPSPTKVALFPPPATTISSTQFHVLGHCTKVGQLLEINFWPSPSDMEAQSNPFNKYQDNAAVASRRGVIFSLYALEEVYKDILESPP